MKTLHIDNLVIKCLCKTHNEKLSYIDEAAIDFQNAWRELTREHHKLEKHSLPKNRPPFCIKRRLRVNGPRLERWALKTMINCAHLFGHQNESALCLTRVARVVFGLERLKPSVGLAIPARIGESILNTESCHVEFVSEQGRPVAIFIDLRGGLKLLTTWQAPLSVLKECIPLKGQSYTQSNIVPQPKKFDFYPGHPTVGLSLHIDWSEHAYTDRWNCDPEVQKLRGKYAPPSRKKKRPPRRNR